MWLTFHISVLGQSSMSGTPPSQQFSSCGSRPLWGLNDPFPGVTCQISCLSNIYITIYNEQNYNYEVTMR